MVSLRIKSVNTVILGLDGEDDYVDMFLNMDCEYNLFEEALDQVYIPLRNMGLKIGTIVPEIMIHNDGSIVIKISNVRENHVPTCLSVITYELSYLCSIFGMGKLGKYLRC